MSITDRREFLSCFAAFGPASTLLPGVLWAQVQEKKPAATIAGRCTGFHGE